LKKNEYKNQIYNVIKNQQEINFLRLKIQRLLSTKSSPKDTKIKKKENVAIEKKINKYSNKNNILKEDIRQENVNLVISLYKGLKNQKIRRESNELIQ